MVVPPAVSGAKRSVTAAWLAALGQQFADALMSAEADALCNAGYGQVSQERVKHHDGYRPQRVGHPGGHRRAGHPRLRHGSHFPHWLLVGRRRAVHARISVVATAYLLGVATRRVERIAESLGVTQLSKSQVSAMARHLDAQVTALRDRPWTPVPLMRSPGWMRSPRRPGCGRW
jgi:putative transposase